MHKLLFIDVSINHVMHTMIVKLLIHSVFCVCFWCFAFIRQRLHRKRGVEKEGTKPSADVVHTPPGEAQRRPLW